MAKFKLIEIEDFDARRGYSRWVSLGVGCHVSGNPKAEADIWLDPRGRLVTRFTSLGYTLHFLIKPMGKIKITPDMEYEIENFLVGKLLEWIVEGVDDSLY